MWVNIVVGIIAIVSVIGLVGCSVSHSASDDALHESSYYYDYIQPSFTEYVVATREWLVSNRNFISNNSDKELAMNMPSERGNKNTSRKAVLLVHGLGDSPYSFSDIGKSLEGEGFYVQTLLLPGHGSKPEDLMLPNYTDWQRIVDHYANLLKQDFDTVLLGGFSTGANLVTIHAIEQGNIDGLVLFSPGFQSKTPKLERLAPLAAVFIDGYKAEERNAARYTSAPLNGAIAYSNSAVKVRELLKDKTIDIPTLIAISEADSVVDPFAIKDLYLNRFNNPKNHMLWYGESEFTHDSITSLSMRLPDNRISTGSHMSPLFSPDNSFYGVGGEHKMCANSFDKNAVEACERGEGVWFSAWGYQEDGKIHARLTWNPYYRALEDAMSRL
ncbi:alpha/beta fold hydrolase [Alteromonas sp. KUL49]|uniref:alpha/beta hydrolase n=1 Tax=Alteromonas sp. KUL49 TaxID=2480798 RepID=UPI001A91CD3A|nr:alpha/beta fold hydrolase [Alteromonas sp. KUL49]